MAAVVAITRVWPLPTHCIQSTWSMGHAAFRRSYRTLSFAHSAWRSSAECGFCCGHCPARGISAGNGRSMCFSAASREKMVADVLTFRSGKRQMYQIPARPKTDFNPATPHDTFLPLSFLYQQHWDTPSSAWFKTSGGECAFSWFRGTRYPFCRPIIIACCCKSPPSAAWFDRPLCTIS